MSEFSMQGPGKTAGVSASGLLLSCLALLLSSLVSHSHPLLAYLVKFLSFLSPLFITTFLVLLALLTLSPGFSREGPGESRPGYLFGALSSVVNKFRTNAGGESEGFDVFEESEVYRIIFEASDLESGRNRRKGEDSGDESDPPVDKFLIYGDHGTYGSDDALLPPSETEENPDEMADPDIESRKKSEALLQDLFRCETENLEMEEGEVKVRVKAEGEDSEKVEGGKRGHNSKSDSLWMKGSEAKSNDEGDSNIFITGSRQSSRRVGRSSSRIHENGGAGEINGNFADTSYQSPEGIMGLGLGSFGSMRREKEWKRTLACKLFEERHNVEGEGMDSLWETYEDDSNNKVEVKRKNSKKWKMGRVSSERVAGNGGDGDCEEGEGQEEEEEEEEMDEKFCCLQALRLSAGKMNLGMGRPNLVRISKAFRGIGWLHHVGKHGKKA